MTLVLDEPVGDELRLAYTDIEKARTVFEWGPAPKPGSGSKPGTRRTSKPKRSRSAPTGAQHTTEPTSGTEVTPT